MYLTLLYCISHILLLSISFYYILIPLLVQQLAFISSLGGIFNIQYILKIIAILNIILFSNVFDFIFKYLFLDSKHNEMNNYYKQRIINLQFVNKELKNELYKVEKQKNYLANKINTL